MNFLVGIKIALEDRELQVDAERLAGLEHAAKAFWVAYIVGDEVIIVHDCRCFLVCRGRTLHL